MSKTYWAIKRRERAERAAALTPKPAAAPAEEEPSYRDLQAQAKELDIPANQSADELKAAIEEAATTTEEETE